MKKYYYLVGLLAIPFCVMASSNDNVANLCTPDERVIFTGEVKANHKIVSICENGRNLQYRYGKPGNIDIMLPKDITQQNTIKTAYRGNSTIGYSISYFRFINKNYSYLISYGTSDDGSSFASLNAYKENGSGGAETATVLSNLEIKDNYYLDDSDINVDQDRDDEDYSWF